jgi:hypothetical protein
MSEETTVALERHLSKPISQGEGRRSATPLARRGGGMNTARHKRNPSFPTGKDEPREVIVVRESWIEYQTKEKRFSKVFALALIALHKHLAKPGHGSFWAHLKELKIPRMTAYRLMQLHGWKAEKRKAEKPKAMAEEEDNRIAKDQAITKAIGYFQCFEGETLREKFKQFCEELSRELFAEVA